MFGDFNAKFLRNKREDAKTLRLVHQVFKVIKKADEKRRIRD